MYVPHYLLYGNHTRHWKTSSSRRGENTNVSTPHSPLHTTPCKLPNQSPLWTAESRQPHSHRPGLPLPTPGPHVPTAPHFSHWTRSRHRAHRRPSPHLHSPPDKSAMVAMYRLQKCVLLWTCIYVSHHVYNLTLCFYQFINMYRHIVTSDCIRNKINLTRNAKKL